MLLLVVWSPAATAGHGDNGSSTPDRDNNTQEWDHHDLTAAGKVACNWGAERLSFTEITMAGPGENSDIHCWDYYYEASFFGLTGCEDLNSTGRCDHYRVDFNLRFYGQIDNAAERGNYHYVGCHEFGHTSSIGHRAVDADDNSCMVDGSGNQFFDDHDRAEINADYP